MRKIHQDNSTLLLEKWMLCMIAVMIQQVFARMKVRNKLECILFLKHHISLKSFVYRIRTFEYDRLEIEEDCDGHD